jgi:hypothetical protein
VLFHGHGMDYLFQGMYLPATQFTIMGRPTYLRWMRPLAQDVVSEYLTNIKFRLKHVDLFRYIRPAWQARLRDYLHSAVQDVLDEGHSLCRTSADRWEYLLIHALSRHYSNCNISDLITSAEQRTVTFENDLFNFYLGLPARQRFAAAAMRRALRMMDPRLARLEMANTGVKIDASPLELQVRHTFRHLCRVLTGNARYRHPTDRDRTWPYRDITFRQHPMLKQAVREACRSEVLVESLPFLDLDVVSNDIDEWFQQPRGGGGLMATLVTIDRFLRQP